VLGPEQLERILALRPSAAADLVQGPASALARQLRRVLEPFPGPRRLELLLDLWARVEEHHAGLARRQRLIASQSRRDRVEDLRKRRQHYDDELILEMLRADTPDHEPSRGEAARWTAPSYYWDGRLRALVQDALAATALLRTAVAVTDHGLADGLACSAGVLHAAAAMLHAWYPAASSNVPGLTGLPARPGIYVRDILRWHSGDKPRDQRFAAYVTPRLGCARDYALVVIDSVGDQLHESLGVRNEVLRAWASSDLRKWRGNAGYTSVRPPADWAGIPSWMAQLLPETESLAQRLAAMPSGQDSADVEVVGDMLWYAELVDALAALYGHRAARGPLGAVFPWLEHDPPPAAEPLSPRLDSITLAVCGAAQLVELGGTPPRRARAWADLTDGLLASTSIAEAITGEFLVPPPLAALDESIVDGTGLRLRVARNVRTLAEWSDYMGNCIAGLCYADKARAGQSVLTGLYDKNGILIANAELVRRRPAVRGWRVEEIAARFDDAPDEALERRFREWVEVIPATAVTESAPAQPEATAPGRAVRRRSVPRLVEDVGPALGALARQAWEEATTEVTGVFAALAGTAPDAALARLRRLRPGPLADACSGALDAGTVTLHALWAASGVGPRRATGAAPHPPPRGSV
jgi:hypothetical protein